MRLALLVVLLTLAVSFTPAAADPARDAILADLLAAARQADPALAAFSAERGEALFRAKHEGGDAEANSCTACHSGDPKAMGQNAKTGKSIEPMAVSVNGKRFTNREDVEKWFRRNCRDAIGRECTAAEKGDFIAFMLSQ